jgi:hypothetical protein
VLPVVSSAPDGRVCFHAKAVHHFATCKGQVIGLFTELVCLE